MIEPPRRHQLLHVRGGSVIHVKAKHATLSYEELKDGSFGMVGRLWDQEVIVKLGEEPDALGEIHPAADSFCFFF